MDITTGRWSYRLDLSKYEVTMLYHALVAYESMVRQFAYSPTPQNDEASPIARAHLEFLQYSIQHLLDVTTTPRFDDDEPGFDEPEPTEIGF